MDDEQKPVGWQQELANILCRIHRDGGHYIAEHGWRKAINDADLKVAHLNAASETTPQPQREWVGLTDDEILAIGQELGLKCKLAGNPNIDFDYARAIEAKLKDKNT
jgi:hypothetical protein